MTLGKNPMKSICFGGHELQLMAMPALWWPKHELLVVSDLHLEKGSSFAVRGELLPPYDTHKTLSMVEALCKGLGPKKVISLGDSFHDVKAAERLTPDAVTRIQALTSKYDWIWIEGNHDPQPPRFLGGAVKADIIIDGIKFQHLPLSSEALLSKADFSSVICGHLHPVAKLKARGRYIRRKVFAFDDRQLVMPSLGAFTGGLNILDEAVAHALKPGWQAYAIGRDGAYRCKAGHLKPDSRKAA